MPPFVQRKGVHAASSGPSSAAGCSFTKGSYPSHAAGGANSSPSRKKQNTSLSSAAGTATNAGSATPLSMKALVGDVTETTEEHMKRHFPFNESCPRCQWIRHGDKWNEKYCIVPSSQRTPLTGEYWCVPRQPRRGGKWALGCTVCALAHESNTRGSNNRVSGLSARQQRRRDRRFDTKWARQEIRSVLDVSGVKQHARGVKHNRALRLLNRLESNEE